MALEILPLGGTLIVEKNIRNKSLEAFFVAWDGRSLDGVGLVEFKVLRSKRLVFLQRQQLHHIMR